MFLAMNRFTVLADKAQAFEDLWLGRESQLNEMEGFVAFHMLKGPADEEAGTVLYASHTVWSSEETFHAWTRSEQFRAAHKNAGSGPKLFEGPPKFEGFTAIQEITAS